MALREHKLVRHTGQDPHPAHSCPTRKDEAQDFMTELSSSGHTCALDLYESILPLGLWAEQKLSQNHFLTNLNIQVDT